jgi:hypothetical protein
VSDGLACQALSRFVGVATPSLTLRAPTDTCAPAYSFGTAGAPVRVSVTRYSDRPAVT